jgi:CheY-like chemotaxis protein
MSIEVETNMSEKPSPTAVKSVLLVDDDAGIRETMSDILKFLNIDVTTASNGYDAIKLAESRDFDVIIMDIKMPGINGVEAFKCIKHYKPRSRVIFMTGYAPDDVMKEAKQEGASAILYKPLDLNNLEKILGVKKDGIDLDSGCRSFQKKMMLLGYMVEIVATPGVAGGFACSLDDERVDKLMA